MSERELRIEMFQKIESLRKLEYLGLNIHRYYLPESYMEYRELLARLGQCTIRTDLEDVSKDLPFYIVTEQSVESDINFIWYDAQEHGYKLILSDGIKHDVVQEYNLVVCFQRNGDFVFEASDRKIPLRRMYRYPLLSCAGNIAEELAEWEIRSNLYGLDRRNLKRDLEELYTYGLYNKWLEVTKYPYGVGIRNENFVFWQIV